MTLEYNPWLKLKFDHADELVLGDVSVMTARAVNYANTMNVESGAKRGFISDVYSALAAQDEQHMQTAADQPYEPLALAYARQILPMLRASASEGFDETFYLSDALILAGDSNEPQRAYEDINNNTDFTPIGRLTRLWMLAQAINRRETQREL
jgi:hypothetical protein